MMKHIVITGGTSGVGLAIAKDLARAGHQLIIVGRAREKALAAKAKIAGNVTIVLGDLASVAGRQKVITEISANWDQIDVLINSAGVLPRTAQENIDTNFLSHYYFTIGLREKLTGGRVLLVTGMPLAVKMAPISENQVGQLHRAAWLLTHKTLLMYLLADQLKKQRTTVNSFFPGDVRSDLMPYTANLQNTMVPVGQYLATHPDFEGITAIFFDQNGEPVALNPRRYNATQAEIVLGKYVESQPEELAD